MHADFDLRADFFDWVLNSFNSGWDRPGRILAFEVEESSLLDPLLQLGISLDALGRSDLAARPDSSYGLILCPTAFLSPEKETVPVLASQLARLAAPGSLTLALFPPAWLPSDWADKVIKFHKEGNTKLYFRFKNHISAFTYYTNREISLLFPDLYLERLTILQDGFRRAHFILKPKTNA